MWKGLNMRRFGLSLVLAVVALGTLSCAKSTTIFPQLTTQIASPSALAVDIAANRLYVVNSNSEVLYDPNQGSFQVYDITNPLAPTLITTTATPSYSGEIYLDAATKTAYVPNRYSTSEQARYDAIFYLNTDTTSANYMTYTSTPAMEDVYAIECCYPADTVWVTAGAGALQYFNTATPTQLSSVSLATTLDTGNTITADAAAVDYIAILGNMAYVSRSNDISQYGVFVVNLDQAMGAASGNPVNYYLADLPNPRGIATDGTNVYIVTEGNRDGDWHRSVTIIDPTQLPARTGNDTTAFVLTEDSAVVKAYVEVGQMPQQIYITTNYAFVTNQGDDNTVSAINLTAGGYPMTTITGVGTAPYSMELYKLPGGPDQYLYVGNLESNNFSIIDIPSLTVVATAP